MTQSPISELADAHESAADASREVSPSRGGRTLRIALEVALISAGVFLGLAGDQWRENAWHRDLAKKSMERFRSEIVANRESLAYIDPDLAADVSRIYSRQARIGELNRGIIQAMYLLSPRDNFDGMAEA
ncbi:MAG: hypothetical protein ABIP93_00010 [Gemmatimonadaceae bacterium]